MIFDLEKLLSLDPVKYEESIKKYIHFFKVDVHVSQKKFEFIKNRIIMYEDNIKYAEENLNSIEKTKIMVIVKLF